MMIMMMMVRSWGLNNDSDDRTSPRRDEGGGSDGTM